MYLIKENIMFNKKMLEPGEKSALSGLPEGQIKNLLARGVIEQVADEKPKLDTNKAKGNN